MQFRFLPLVTALFFTALVSTSCANNFKPRLGQYTGTDNHGGHISFRVITNDHRYEEVIDLHIRGHFLGKDYRLVNLKLNQFGFYQLFGIPVRGGSPGRKEYRGHGKWDTREHVAGDFRYYEDHLKREENDYYTWSAEWRHE